MSGARRADRAPLRRKREGTGVRSGLTALALADRDPEEARTILDPVLTLMMEAVHHYEGTVNQVMGDGIMALFGAPVAHEDHAVRACYAALRMQNAARRYSEELRRERRAAGAHALRRPRRGAGAAARRAATAYLPVIELLRGYSEVESRDDPRKIREKITGKVLTLAPALAPALLALLDVPVDEASWHALDPLQRSQQTRLGGQDLARGGSRAHHHRVSPSYRSPLPVFNRCSKSRRAGRAI
jgi:hypothetical protein